MIGAKSFLHVSSGFLGVLLFIYLIGNVTSDSAENNHCIWYGLCSNPSVEKIKYCSYNGTALPIENVSMMEKYCPELVAGGRACCNHEQLEIMNRALSVPESLLSNCPACMKNFFKHTCAMICGPNQSDYLKPVKIGSFNATRDRVLEIDYHLGKTYKESTFNSCINVLVPPRLSGNPDEIDKPTKALDLMCGIWAAENCTSDRWFEFMGDENNPFVAFQINFVGDDSPVDGFTPYNPDTSRGCNVDANVTSASAENNHCIWYGLCSNPGVEKIKYCSYNGTALPIENVSMMEKYCPELVAGGRACCNHEQLDIMNRALSVPESLLSNCPACMKNFFKHTCAMICGPNQSDYLKPVKIGSFNATRDRVLEIDYHLGKTYKESTFNSCINVLVPPRLSGNPDKTDKPTKALDLMCGDWAAENCTSDRWFEFMGDENNPYVAFQINFVGDDSPVDGFTPYNPDTSRGCNVDANSAGGTSEELQQSENSPSVNSNCSVNPRALYWSTILDSLNPTQKLHAENFINYILLEAKLGNLDRHSVRIYPSPRKLDSSPSQPPSEGPPTYTTTPFVSINIEGL